MKIKSQSNGVNISAYINTDELEKAILAPYKERLKVLEAQVKKRNNYIKNMHFQLKRRKWMMYLGYISHQLLKPLPKQLTNKRLMCLFYMYERDFTNVNRMKKDFLELGIPVSNIYTDFKYLINIGLVNKDKREFYFILDKGREVVEYYEKNMKIKFWHMAGVKQDVSQIKKEVSPTKECKYSPEELDNRRATYVKLMKPFWEQGLKKMPKDRGKRIELLGNWLKNTGNKDEWYTKRIYSWGSK